MPDIAHRISIAAPPADVHELVATTKGIAAWWTGRTVEGDTAIGSRFAVYFGDAAEPAAAFEVESDTMEQIVWRCVAGPDDWRDTLISFEFKPAPDGGTTLLFGHTGWRQATEFMAGCSTNWGAYLTSLKSGVEGDGFGAYPAGEISRWG
jgi:uncharacterized protein YndB with AHSA1/START domain